MSRIDLRDMNNSENLRTQCEHCLSIREYHVNRIIAVGNKKKGLIVLGVILALMAIATKVLWDIGFVSTATFALPIFVYILYQRQEGEKLRNFNKLLL